LEGKFKGKEDEWRELNFKYKPGALDRAPVFAAPYQVRIGRLVYSQYRTNPPREYKRIEYQPRTNPSRFQI
jgi:hypothetical protein